MDIFSIPPKAKEECCQALASGKSVRIERIVSTGHRSPEGFWYNQFDDEWLCLLSGSAELLFERCSVILKKGDSLLIPAHTRHRVENTSSSPPCIWLCVFGDINNNTATEENQL